MFNFNEKIIFKKFLLNNTYFFLFIIINLSLIVWIIQAINYLDFVTDDGHGFEIYFYYTILNLPKVFTKLVPFVFFISIFYTITKYEENNELKLFWINGINKTKFINVLIKYTLALFIIQILLTALISPFTQDKARSFLKKSNLDFFPSLIQEKKFIDTVKNLTIFIEKKNSNNEFENVYIKDELIGENNSKVIFAEKGKLEYDNNGKSFIKLFNGKLLNIGQERTIIFNFQETNFDLSNFVTKSTTFKKVQELDNRILFKCLKEFYIYKKVYQDENAMCDKNFIKEIKQEIYKRLIKPTYLFLIVVFSCFLLLKSNENQNYSKMKFVVFLFNIFIIILSEISVAYSGKSNFNTLFFTLLPILAFLLSYFILKNKLLTMNINK
tara:strand:- start:56 stop:1204 length:1149 start_codon:yes stop_codon:yes gene_type:complete